MKVAILVLILGAVGGCTTAGPFVTDISSDGDNGITMTKCMAKLNSFTGTISNATCTTSNIQLYHRKL